MGLFDRRRRRKETKKVGIVRGREHMTPARPMAEPTPPPDLDRMTPEAQGEIVTLVAEYERLVARREELQVERGQLTAQLDRGDLTAIEFRKQLMVKIQEAAQVSETLKETSGKLTALGYRGVLH
ncbi:MAG: hypothetical protein RTU92_01965 [Candidatus Thorarchaeota archaeon]